ncbi:unnamed protein product [Phytophthora fragariaefolia]|uniref:Unnamed protein product n=1 Tax=Phytophthora fragariaefolia TaxID=1490495 RepID=A0A9W7DBX8_9STRA|nr:unnamed protein product [Phytophthora fragariaefolia]
MCSAGSTELGSLVLMKELRLRPVPQRSRPTSSAAWEASTFSHAKLGLSGVSVQSTSAAFAGSGRQRNGSWHRELDDPGGVDAHALSSEGSSSEERLPLWNQVQQRSVDESSRTSCSLV